MLLEYLARILWSLPTPRMLFDTLVEDPSLSLRTPSCPFIPPLSLVEEFPIRKHCCMELVVLLRCIFRIVYLHTKIQNTVEPLLKIVHNLIVWR